MTGFLACLGKRVHLPHYVGVFEGGGGEEDPATSEHFDDNDVKGEDEDDNVDLNVIDDTPKLKDKTGAGNRIKFWRQVSLFKWIFAGLRSSKLGCNFDLSLYVLVALSVLGKASGKKGLFFWILSKLPSPLNLDSLYNFFERQKRHATFKIQKNGSFFSGTLP